MARLRQRLMVTSEYPDLYIEPEELRWFCGSLHNHGLTWQHIYDRLHLAAGPSDTETTREVKRAAMLKVDDALSLLDDVEASQ